MKEYIFSTRKGNSLRNNECTYLTTIHFETQPNHVVQGTLTKVITSINEQSCNKCMSLL